MEVQSGIGTLAELTVVVLVGLAVYLALWTEWAARRGLGGVRVWELRSTILGLGIIALSLVPLSLINFGWVVVPVALLLVSFAFALTHSAVRATFAACDDGEPLWVMLSFAVPMAILAPVVASVSFVQAGQAAGSSDSAFRAMAGPGLMSLIALGALPPLVAAGYIVVTYTRQR